MRPAGSDVAMPSVAASGQIAMLDLSGVSKRPMTQMQQGLDGVGG